MKTLRAIEIYKDTKLTLIAIESVDYQQSKTNMGWRLFGKIEPTAVIVCGTDTTYALDMESNPADFGYLKQEIPELDAIIAPFIKQKAGTYRVNSSIVI